MSTCAHLRTGLGVVSVVLILLNTTVSLAARRVVSLDGTWEIAQGKDTQAPDAFGRKAPVPGLVDMAEPAFKEIGTTRSAELRESFWYRRRFKVDGAIPAVALLKLHKVKYGCTVFLNGRQVGANPRHFTPGWFDLRPHLKGKGADNELLVRVGGRRRHPKGSPANGWDFEKKRYIPGIYDSVELILSPSPHIVNVRTAPDVARKTLRIVVELANAGKAPANAKLKFAVKEALSGKAVGSLEADPVSVPAAAQPVVQSYPPHRIHALKARGDKKSDSPARCTVDVTIPIKDARLWTPEDPFLYKLQVDAGGDSCAVRFGMRQFHYDAETKRPMLNGRPYYLRGTNICILRFFEDPARGTRPWDPKWVRGVIRGFRKMNWNSCRYCIGFPPEIWYDIADEEGLLVQDEFPIWLLDRRKPANIAFHKLVKPEALSVEYADWMFERQNHACVYMWDAQNESSTAITTAALAPVRGLDLQGRPWDGGYGKPDRPTDTKEEHPYFFVRWKGGGTLKRFGALKPLVRKNPLIINEYAWLWLNRDGTPCSLPRKHKSYATLLPPGVKPTPDVYRRVYARTLSAMTEKFRADRTCAGVMHFCGLGYSRPPDGETSDNYIELKGPTFEPHFAKYVSDAFAPNGIMLDLWDPHLAPGEEFTAPVVTINDRNTQWAGQVHVKIFKGDTVLSETHKPVTIPPAGRVEMKFSLKAPTATGRYLVAAELVRDGDKPVRSLRDVTVAVPDKPKK